MQDVVAPSGLDGRCTLSERHRSGDAYASARRRRRRLRRAVRALGRDAGGLRDIARGAATSPEQLLAWTNERLGKPQRLSAVRVVDSLPRSDIGKVLKRQLRDSYAAVAAN